MWFPGEHMGIGYSKKQKDYFNQKFCPEFQNNTQYPLLRKLIITEDMARGMAEHCCIEYRNLCEILPLLYEEYK